MDEHHNTNGTLMNTTVSKTNRGEERKMLSKSVIGKQCWRVKGEVAFLYVRHW